MILECPECRTRYLVPDSAIGAEGRTVRCATCRHSWFQEPPPLEENEETVAGQGEADGQTPSVAVPPAAAPAGPVVVPPPSPDGFDAFAHRPPFRARRSPARRNTALAVAVGGLLLILIVLIAWLGRPGLGAQLGFGSAESPLRIRDNPIERRELENGSELFAISGQVTNPSSERQRVPDIRAELRDARCRLVFSWTITPQVRSVAPGGSVEFNSAKLDVPATSKSLELSFAGEGGSPASQRCRNG